MSGLDVDIVAIYETVAELHEKTLAFLSATPVEAREKEFVSRPPLRRWTQRIFPSAHTSDPSGACGRLNARRMR